MRPSISEGYVPGCIGRIAQLHAAYYAQTSGFGVEFEANGNEGQTPIYSKEQPFNSINTFVSSY